VPAESGLYFIQIIIEEAGVDIRSHSGRSVPKHALDCFDVAPAETASDAAVCRRS
jgi:hypothetical protein